MFRGTGRAKGVMDGVGVGEAKPGTQQTILTWPHCSCLTYSKTAAEMSPVLNGVHVATWLIVHLCMLACA